MKHVLTFQSRGGVREYVVVTFVTPIRACEASEIVGTFGDSNDKQIVEKSVDL